MAKKTNRIAPKNHYYIVEWNESLCLRNCSEYLFDDEEVVDLMTKSDFYEMRRYAESKGVYLLESKETFLAIQKAFEEEWK